jgi:hypothetical protein
LAAAAMMRSHYNLQYTTYGAARFESALEYARSQMDADAFAREWELGRELLVEDLLEQALGF